MLLTDGSPNTIDSLSVYEASIESVSATEGIDLNIKMDLATEEISEDILDVLLDQSASDPHAADRRTLGVSDVVVTPQLKRWHAVHSLELVYRDAFNNQLNDRYGQKFKEYALLTVSGRLHTTRFGIGIVLTPIPKGNLPLFSYVAGLIPATTYYVQITWVSSAGQEGAPSDITTYDAPDGSLPVVSIQNPPAVAIGFNVYMGLSTTVTLQNGLPVPLDMSFTLPASGLIAGQAVGSGQSPDAYVVGGPTMKRG